MRVKKSQFVTGMLLLAAGVTAGTAAAKEKMPPADAKRFHEMSKPVRPYRIIGNIYYVGASDLASFLIVTPAGHILIDPGMEEMAPQVEQNIEALGFHAADIKYLLNTQAHIDHAAAFAALKRVSGATLLVSKEDAPVIESGGATDFLWADRFRWEPAKVDGLVNDGEEVKLGGTVLTAHLTPGHTKGCTTWTMTVKEGGKEYRVVFLGSTTRVGAKLVGNSAYPQIGEDYESTFRKLRALPCDVFLASHASFYDGLAKAAKLRRSRKPNPFIDPAGYKAFLDAQERGFREELTRAQGEH